MLIKKVLSTIIVLSLLLGLILIPNTAFAGVLYDYIDAEDAYIENPGPNDNDLFDYGKSHWAIEEGQFESPVITTEQKRAGSHSIRYKVNSSTQAKDRIEHSVEFESTNYDQCHDIWRKKLYLSFSVYFPSNFQTPTGWFVFYQIKQHEPAFGPSPNIAFEVHTNGTIRIALRHGHGDNSNPDTISTYQTIGNLSDYKGKWTDFLVAFKLTDLSDGVAQVFQKSTSQSTYTKVVDYSGMTGFTAAKTDSIQIRGGIYRKGSSASHTLYIDEVRYGTDINDVKYPGSSVPGYEGGGGEGPDVEAESASGQGNFSPFVVGNDATASGGSYIHAPNNNSTGSVPANGQVSYPFSLSSAGDIQIDARILAETTASDSFYYRIDSGSWNTWYISNTSSNWQTVSKTISDLSSGNHTLWIAYREGKCKLDKFTINGATGGGGSSYSEDFNDGSAQNWALNHMLVDSSALKTPDYSGNNDTGIYNGITFSANYTYSVDVYTTAGGTGNIARIFFNYTDDNNHYRIEATGGDSATVSLIKKADGTETVLDTYSYSIRNATVKFEISFTSGGYITVKATKSGATTTLFNNIQDSSLNSGKIGVGGRYMLATFDNVEVLY